ncbi:MULTISPECIES: GyrI-like domain-containing protein [Lactobacillus]|uniref:Transcriptional regulator n=1 Tax=Lactobacillus xujianguonis TaxID=2495899 RepID=A0A437SUH3_9LACO|nr:MULTISPECIES: GyrI-like domain-containing protein [Lactobacillus]RVU70589.1 transcriptional regulator [Lactobacillus xujianguonis]RVU73786.1 transcriptional regulator [Lactobacillus xujianguonis]
MAYDFKKEEKQFYRPGKKPEIVEVPTMTFLAVQGHGDPNQVDSDYQQKLQLLYSLAYTIKMSKIGSHRIQNYFDFVVPPLEGFWWQAGVSGVDYAHKEKFNFISCIRMPDFVTLEVLVWAKEEAAAKKGLNFAPVKLLTMTEGKCVQIMHLGDYDAEPATIAKMHDFIKANNLALDFSEKRRHHEIYLSNPQRTKRENLKTIIRLPVKEK